MLETLYQRLVQVGFAHPQAQLEPKVATDLFRTAILDSGLLATTMPAPAAPAATNPPSNSITAGTEAEESAAKKVKLQMESQIVA